MPTSVEIVNCLQIPTINSTIGTSSFYRTAEIDLFKFLKIQIQNGRL